MTSPLEMAVIGLARADRALVSLARRSASNQHIARTVLDEWELLDDFALWFDIVTP